jgi:hypothetical protein
MTEAPKKTKLEDYGKCIVAQYTPATGPDPLFIKLMGNARATRDKIAMKVMGY